MKDLIAILVIVLIISLAIRYIIKSKKNGVKCIGCPYQKECASKNKNTNCNCNSENI